MKKILMIVISAFICTYPLAQTKPKQNNSKPKPTLVETANWIVEKLNAYSTSYYYSQGVASMTQERYSFTYNGETQVLKVTHYNKNKDNVSQRSYRITNEIPIQNILKIKKDNSGSAWNNAPCLYLYTTGKVIKEISYETDGSLDKVVYSNSFDVPFDFETENNIYIRLEKAFADLIAFFPRKKEAY